MNARLLAFRMLKEICLEKKYSNLLLRKELGQVDVKDRGFVTQIVYGTLQNYRLCRYQWTPFVKKMPTEETAVLLDMSVYQLFYMDKVPAYAIINEAVNITKKDLREGYANLVNAILHNVERAKEREVSGSKEEVLAIKTSHPDWIVKMWIAQYGYDVAEAICYANLETKPNAVRVNTYKTVKADILKESDEFVEGKLSEDALWYTGNQLIHSSYYEQGLLSIQDEASQMVARILDPQPKESILDVCSAPGTKSCHMAELMKNEGRIVCGDIHPHRVELIGQGASRLGLTIIEPRTMDACTLSELEGEKFDRVLCDVPCSGYGVLARKSDIKYHMVSEDMDTLIPLQKQILETSSFHVKEGGILVYSTCTLNKKENEKQVENFLKNHGEFELLEQKTIYPFEYESDGFFIAKMKKV